MSDTPETTKTTGNIHALQTNIDVAKDAFATKISTDIDNLQTQVFSTIDIDGLMSGKGLQGVDGSQIVGTAISHMLIGSSHDNIHTEIMDYLTHTDLGDNISDRVLGTKINFALQQFGDEGKKLVDSIHLANDKFQSIKTQHDLDNLTKELHLDNDDVVVDDTDFYQDENVDNVTPSQGIDISDKKQILLSSITSEPLEWNKQTGVTRCSLTARKNSKNFGIVIPKGNAFDAKNVAPIDARYKTTIEKSNNQVFSLDDMDTIDDKLNVADVFVYSAGKYAKFGHRCMMFKNMTDKKWYVLDPYRASQSNGSDRASKTDPSSVESSKPKLLEDYITYNKIAKINFYESPYAVVNQYDADAIV